MRLEYNDCVVVLRHPVLLVAEHDLLHSDLDLVRLRLCVLEGLLQRLFRLLMLFIYSFLDLLHLHELLSRLARLLLDVLILALLLEQELVPNGRFVIPDLLRRLLGDVHSAC